MEWFIYNRTPAYDAIIKAAEARGERQSEESVEPVAPSSADRTSDDSLKQADSAAPCNQDPQPGIDEPSFLLHLLPIQVVSKKGAIVLGNTNTPSLVVAQFVQADMAIDAAESRSKFDLYKMIYNCVFTRPTVQIKTNIDFKESLLARASHVVEKADVKVTKYPAYEVPDNSRTVQSMWRTVRDLIPFFQESTESLARPPTPKSEQNGNEVPWSGLPRYSNHLAEDASTAAEAETDPTLQPTDVTEYAKVTTILDSAELQLIFYYDEPGRVPPMHQQLPSDEEHIGNGDMSPEWGMDIEVSGATISYGPWADRQRVSLQEMFFPGSYEDAKLESPLKVGDQRIYAYFKLLVEFKDNATFKVPTKEKSKVFSLELLIAGLEI
jgi:hypothetical protein